MKIVILDGYTVNHGDLSWDGLKEFGELTVYDRTPKDPETILSRIGDAEAVLENKINMSREIMDACPNLKYIGEIATGYNNVDIAAAREKGTAVRNNLPAAVCLPAVKYRRVKLFHINIVVIQSLSHDSLSSSLFNFHQVYPLAAPLTSFGKHTYTESTVLFQCQVRSGSGACK